MLKMLSQSYYPILPVARQGSWSALQLRQLSFKATPVVAAKTLPALRHLPPPPPVPSKEAKEDAAKRALRFTLQKLKASLPPPPKRPLSAFLAYAAVKRPILLQNSNDSLVQTSKTLSKAWSTLPEAEKATFEAQAKKAREAYASDAEAYAKKLSVQNRALWALCRTWSTKLGKRVMLPVGMERLPGTTTRNAYAIFAKQKLAAMGKSSGGGVTEVTDRMKAIAREWRDLSEEEKAKLQATASAELAEEQKSPEYLTYLSVKKRWGASLDNRTQAYLGHAKKIYRYKADVALYKYKKAKADSKEKAKAKRAAAKERTKAKKRVAK